MCDENIMVINFLLGVCPVVLQRNVLCPYIIVISPFIRVSRKKLEKFSSLKAYDGQDLSE